MYDPKTIAAVQKIVSNYGDSARRDYKRFTKENSAKFFSFRRWFLHPPTLRIIYAEVEDTMKKLRDELQKLPRVDGDVSTEAGELGEIRAYLEKNLPELMEKAGKKARIADVVVAILENKTK